MLRNFKIRNNALAENRDFKKRSCVYVYFFYILDTFLIHLDCKLEISFRSHKLSFENIRDFLIKKRVYDSFMKYFIKSFYVTKECSKECFFFFTVVTVV